jgi:P27 family predicted phage terminase small subunit
MSAARGAKKLPSNIRVLTGNRGNKPINTAEPKVKIVRPPAPRDLTEREQEKWKEMVGLLYSVGVLGNTDLDALKSYCRAWILWHTTWETLEKEGRYIHGTDQSGNVTIKAHPAWQHHFTALHQIRQLAAEFGLTPASRAKIKAEVVPSDADSVESYFA